MSIQAASLPLLAPTGAGHAPTGHHAPAAPADRAGEQDRAPAGAVTETRGNTVNTTA